MISSKHAPEASISARAASGSAGSPGSSSAGSNAGSTDETKDALAEALREPLTDAEKLEVHLAAAAEAAASSGVNLDEFMRVAWTAYVDSRPGMREHLADAQLVQQISELRSQGKVGLA